MVIPDSPRRRSIPAYIIMLVAATSSQSPFTGSGLEINVYKTSHSTSLLPFFLLLHQHIISFTVSGWVRKRFISVLLSLVMSTLASPQPLDI
ncbi:hypothetical protein QVD17_36431 [Tagetes erecta]|uniref:Uncharacterized protein n=1 Tax=Tagetes erecta TaxID=13708 RepID=A0AAD8JWD8_TARER|nr:hypothetical protein QVD17_36431 [Tagetes erecta]